MNWHQPVSDGLKIIRDIIHGGLSKLPELFSIHFLQTNATEKISEKKISNLNARQITFSYETRNFKIAKK